MEGLLLLGAEFVAALAGLVVVGLQLVAAAVSFLCQLIWWLLERRPGDRRPKWSSRLDDRQREWLRRVGRIAQRAVLGLLAVTLVALALVNFVFLDETAAFVARRVEERTGIAVRFDSMDGNLFTGRFDFTGVHVTQDTSAAAQFDIRAGRLTTRFAMWDLFWGRKVMRSLRIDDIDGSFVRLRATGAEPARQADSGRIVFRLLDMKSRRSFRIDELIVSNAALTAEDRSRETAVSYPIHIRSVVAQPLRSDYLWFDLLYRSNMDLSIDGTEVVVENSTADGMRHTLWSITDIKAPVLASLVGGPFALFSEGQIDLLAEDTWTLRNEAIITMDWALQLRDVRAEVPRDTRALLRAPATAFVNQVNARTEPWDLGFTLTLREAQFAGAATLDAQQIWAGAMEAFLKESIGLDEAGIDSLKNRARAGLTKFEEFLKKREEQRTGPDP